MSVLDLFKLNGKAALVTGCRRGIGKSMAVALAEAGADIVGVSATLEPDSAVEREICALGRQFHAYSCDFADRAALRAFIVNVNAIAPGYIATDNTEALRNDPNRSRQILERIPAGRWRQPEDFAGAVVFLASTASDYMHGTILTIDGGWISR